MAVLINLHDLIFCAIQILAVNEVNIQSIIILVQVHYDYGYPSTVVS